MRQVSFFARNQASPHQFTERMKQAIDSPRGRKLYSQRMAHRRAGVCQHPAQQAAQPLHAQDAAQGQYAVDAVLPGAQHREVGEQRVCAGLKAGKVSRRGSIGADIPATGLHEGRRLGQTGGERTQGQRTQGQVSHLAFYLSQTFQRATARHPSLTSFPGLAADTAAYASVPALQPNQPAAHP